MKYDLYIVLSSFSALMLLSIPLSWYNFKCHMGAQGCFDNALHFYKRLPTIFDHCTCSTSPYASTRTFTTTAWASMPGDTSGLNEEEFNQFKFASPRDSPFLRFY